MEIKINFEKKHLYFLVGFLVVIGAILLVKAVVPNPGHPVTEVDLSQDFSIDGNVDFNKFADGWNLIGWSLTGICFEAARTNPSFDGTSGIAGNFDENGNVIYLTPKTGTQICNNAGYNTCVKWYSTGINRGGAFTGATFDVQEGIDCGVSHPYTTIIGPADEILPVMKCFPALAQ